MIPSFMLARKRYVSFLLCSFKDFAQLAVSLIVFLSMAGVAHAMTSQTVIDRVSGDIRQLEKQSGRCQADVSDRHLFACFKSDKTQIVRFTHSELLAYGLDFRGVHKSAFFAHNQGGEVPVFVAAESVFTEQSYLELLVHGMETTYTTEQMYQLYLDFSRTQVSVDNDIFVHITSPQTNFASQATAQLHTDDNPEFFLIGLSDDGWMDPDLWVPVIPKGQSRSVTAHFDLDTATNLNVAAEMRIEFDSSTQLDIQTEVNGIVVSTNVTYDLSRGVGIVSIPANVLVQGQNSLRVIAALANDSNVISARFQLDEYTLRYQRQLVASDNALSFASDATYARVTGLNQASNESTVVWRKREGNTSRQIIPDEPTVYLEGGSGAEYTVLPVGSNSVALIEPREYRDIKTGDFDYLIVSHPNFIDSVPMNTLLSMRQQDYSARVIDVDEIYAQYAAGTFDPWAIHRYLQYRYENHALNMVLLVGDDFYDYRNRINDVVEEESFIPSVYHNPIRYQFYPSDSGYVDFDPNGSTFMPEIAIGRLPVESIDELGNIVDKMVAYQNNQYAYTALLATNHSDGYGETHYQPQLESLFLSTVRPNIVKALVESDTSAALMSAKNKAINAIDQGALLTVYTGHNTQQGPMFKDDVNEWNNVGKPTVGVIIDSLTGLYPLATAPVSSGLNAERFLVAKDVGGVAFFVPSGTVSIDVIQTRFIWRFSRGYTLGESFLLASQAWLNKPQSSYNLLGDPALKPTSIPIDNEAPIITAPDNVMVESDGPTAVDIGQATAIDDSIVTISNDAPNIFPLGETIVTWTARDTFSNESSATQTVTVSLPTVNKATLVSPVPGTTLSSDNVEFEWTSVTDAQYYAIWVGTDGVGSFNVVQDNLIDAATTRKTLQGLPNDGSNVYVRLWTRKGGQWRYNDYQYTAYTGSVTSVVKASLTSPANNSVLTGLSTVFSWNSVPEAQAYLLYFGTRKGSRNLGSRFSIGNDTHSMTVANLPNDGSKVHVRLFTRKDNIWRTNDFEFTAYSGVDNRPDVATLLSPTPNSTLSGTSVNFQWEDAGASLYQILVGSTPGNYDIVFSNLQDFQITLANLPNDNSTVYVRLRTLKNGIWQHRDYQYQAASGGRLEILKASLTAPVPLSTLPAGDVEFQWNNVGASMYEIQIGSVQGSSDLAFRSIFVPNQTSVTISGLPTDGRTIYFRLLTLKDNQWRYQDYQYNAASGG
ncbi:MAG: C25 family cysteine peptidase [Arenicella sp.]